MCHGQIEGVSTLDDYENQYFLKFQYSYGDIVQDLIEKKSAMNLFDGVKVPKNYASADGSYKHEKLGQEIDSVIAVRILHSFDCRSLLRYSSIWQTENPTILFKS